MTNKEILNLEFDSTYLNRTITIKDFFKALLASLFERGEGLINRKSLDNSSWYYDLCACLARNKIIDGECYNSCGSGDWGYDSKQAQDKILELIKEL